MRQHSTYQEQVKECYSRGYNYLLCDVVEWLIFTLGDKFSNNNYYCICRNTVIIISINFVNSID